MLAVEEITAVPEEQELIGALDPFFAELYEPLPHHSYGHARDEVLRTALQLDDLDPTPRHRLKRLELIPEALGHDAKAHEPFVFTPDVPNREARAAELTMALLRGPARGPLQKKGLEFSDPSIWNIGRTIMRTAIGRPCVSPNDIKLGRADISNVASPELEPFLAITARIFHEKVILGKRYGEAAPTWEPYLDVQHSLLTKLINRGPHGFAIGSELELPGKGPFYEQSVANIGQLAANNSIRDPQLFVVKFGWRLKPLVPNWDEVAGYITGRAAA